MEPLRFADAIAGMRVSWKLRIRGRPSYCGTLGQQILIASLPGHEVLKVAAPCRTARKFAVQVVSSLRVG
jgi:hypothetical protein